MIDKLELNRLDLTVHLMRLPRLGWRYAAKANRNPKMTGTMNNICIAVALEEGVSQDTIARKLKMDKSSVAKIVTKAVKEGYLTRETNPKDRREYRLMITDAGRQAVQGFLETLEEWQEKMMSSFSEEEKKQFIELSEKACLQAEEIDRDQHL